MKKNNSNKGNKLILKIFAIVIALAMVVPIIFSAIR